MSGFTEIVIFRLRLGINSLTFISVDIDISTLSMQYPEYLSASALLTKCAFVNALTPNETTPSSVKFSSYIYMENNLEKYTSTNLYFCLNYIKYVLGDNGCKH